MYLPLSAPPSSGDHGVIPRPNSRGHRHQFLFDGALEQRVLDLQPDERRPAAETRGEVGFGDLPRRGVRDAEVAHLAGPNEVVERGHRLLDGGVHVPDVQPVQVDVVGLQAPQRVLAGVDQRLAARAAAVGIARIEVAAELGRDHQAIAAGGVAPDVVADDLLGVALGVEVGGVDEVAAEVDEAVDDLLGLLHAGAPAEVFAERHRPEAQRADA